MLKQVTVQLTGLHPAFVESLRPEVTGDNQVSLIAHKGAGKPLALVCKDLDHSVFGHYSAWQELSGRLGKALLLAAILTLCYLLPTNVSLADPVEYRITSLHVRGGNVIVRWQGGGTNQVECRTNFSSPWHEVDGPTTGSGMTNILLTPVAYYRIKDVGAAMAAAADKGAPTAPTGLTASVMGGTQVNLQWSASTDPHPSSGLKAYNIYRGGIFLRQVTAATTSCPDTSVVPGVSYSYRVSAVDNAGNQSARSASATATAPSVACGYAISPSSFPFGPAGGSSSLSVTTASGCSWMASSTASWIVVTSGASGAGNGTISYSVAANTSTASRTGALIVAGQTLPVSQGGLAVNDTTAPVATFLTPLDGSVLSGVVELKARVTDNDSIANVEFYVDNFGTWVFLGSSLGSGILSTNGTLLTTTIVQNGTHDILCKPFDRAGNYSWTTIRVTTSNDSEDPGNLNWALDTGHSPLTGEAQNSASKVDHQGNVVVVGNFKGVVNFGTTMLTSQGGFDHFVAKYSPTGALLWVRAFAGVYDNVAVGLAIDSSDNIVVAGYFTGTMDLGGGPLASGGGNNNPDPFVAKFNALGVHLWSKRFGGGAGNYARAVAVDGNDDVFVAGEFRGTVNFGGGNTPSAGDLDCFLVKFSGYNGSFVWQRAFASSSADYVGGMTVDANGDPLVSGFTLGSANFGIGTVGSAGGSDAFLVKYAGQNGGYLWARLIAGPGDEAAESVAVSADGNAMVFVTFRGTINLGGVMLNAPLSTGLCIAKYTAGGALVWARSVGGHSSVGGSIGGRAAAVDSAGNVVVTGNATGEADFGNGQLTAGTGSIFVAKYSADGAYVWAKRINSTGWSLGLGLCIDDARNIYSCGTFSGTADFGGITLSSLGSQTKDSYLIKITP